MPHSLSRRDMLKLTGMAAAAITLGPSAAHLLAQPPQLPPPSQRKRSLRIAHMTDTHIQPEKRAGEGVAAALNHVNSLKDKPDLIITGGDHVFDSMGADEPRTKLQWDLFSRVAKDNNAIPILSCVGNHDVWGWNKKKSKTTGDEPNHGKKRVVEALAMPGRYHSSDRAGWHIIALDSVFPNGDSYLAKIDDEQFEWLKGDLAAVKPETPILIVSHIPIFSVAVLEFGGKPERTENKVDPSLMHLDAGKLHALFLKHPNVKACISGHLHLVDRCDYGGVSYFCNGAVCGNWWKGRHRTCDEGYATLNLYDDGTFEREYIAYGWKANA